MSMDFDDEHGDHTGPASLDWALWKRILARAVPLRGSIFQMVLAGLAVAVVDSAVPVLTGFMVDTALESGWTPMLTAAAVGYALAFVVLGAAVVWFIVLAGRIATGLAHDFRRDGFSRMQDLSFSFFDRRPVGWLVARLMGDVARVSGLMPWFFLDVVWGGSTVLLSVTMMLWLDVGLASWVLCIVPMLVGVSWVFQRRILTSSRAVRRSNSRITASYAEAIAGVRTTRALHRETDALEEFQAESRSMERHSVRVALQSALYLPLVMSIGSFGVALALSKGGVRLSDGLSIGTLVAFMQYATLFYTPIQELAQRFTELQGAQAAAERVQTLLESTPEVHDRPEVIAALAAPYAPGLAEDGGEPTISNVEFDDVEFSYVPGEPVLRGVSFVVRSGQTVALVGPTGGGKTTIVSVLARFYDPTAGSVRLDGVDHRDRSLHWLQSNLGVVLQSPHLFAGSIADNIRYGRLDASDADVRDAARRVGAHDMIEALSDGYATAVGEGGGKLSTGQRQLISLARAILADPQIFIMDEATSSLDAESESRVQAGIDAVLQGRIAFVIAHRLSTIRRADMILVVDRGEIVERGTHDALLAAGGRYAELHAQSHAPRPWGPRGNDSHV